MGKKMTRAGMETRRTIRAEIDARPDIDHLELRRKYQVSEGIIESAMSKTVDEWDAIIKETPPDQPVSENRDRQTSNKESEARASSNGDHSITTASTAVMPGIEQGIIKFARKPAKMGMDFIFWVPRVYIKNGLVDPTCEYDVFLKKTSKGQLPSIKKE
ncbi:MAG: hypothetical protein Q6353_002200 [Candidatus Sigynarchaeum springense]